MEDLQTDPRPSTDGNGDVFEDDYDSQVVQHAFFVNSNIIAVCNSRTRLLFCSKSFRNVGSCTPCCDEAEFRIELISGSSLGLVVRDTRKFELWNFKENRRISPSVNLDDRILGIRGNDRRVMVLTSRKLYIFVLNSLELIFTFDRGDAVAEPSVGVLAANDDGLVAFVLADGSVQVIDSITLYPSSPLHAHSSPISALELSSEYLVTGSSRGTIIRVFSLPSLCLLYEFRRGRTENVTRSIKVSGNFITVAGDSDTVHIFRIASTDDRPRIMGLIPTVETATRDFSYIRLRRDEGMRSFSAAVVDAGRAVVVSRETGYAFVYDSSIVGECRLISEHALSADHIPSERNGSCSDDFSSLPSSTTPPTTEHDTDPVTVVKKPKKKKKHSPKLSTDTDKPSEEVYE